MPERSGVHGPLPFRGTWLRPRAVPASGAWPHETGLCLPSTERERRSCAREMLRSERSAAGIDVCPDTVITSAGWGHRAAETATMLPVITAFLRTHQLADVVVVAGAG